MIDYIALTLGHGLLVLVFLRLVLRESLDVDPTISEMQEKAQAQRPRAKRHKAQSSQAAQGVDASVRSTGEQDAP